MSSPRRDNRYIGGVVRLRRIRKLSRAVGARLGVKSAPAGATQPIVRSSSFPFLSGDTFRSMAELILEPEGEIAQHGLHTSVIFADGRVAISDGFLYQLSNAVTRLANPERATLVVHNHVRVPAREQFAEITSLVGRVFSSNVPDGLPGVTPVPLGLENAFRQKNGRLHYYLDAIQQPVSMDQRTELVVSSFHTSTNPGARETARAVLRQSRHGHYEQFFKSLEYRQLIRRTKFVVSPPGNGDDCHRTWEAIYLGAVPVVLRDYLAPSLSDDLPILAVDSYEDFCDLTDEELEETFRTLRERPLTKAWAHHWLKEVLHWN